MSHHTIMNFRPIGLSQERLKKHVAAIHTSGELSLLERKLSNVLLLNAYDDLLTVRTHRIRVSALMVIVGWEQGKNVGWLRAALRKLATTAIEFNVMGEINEQWGVSSIISYAEIRNGWCVYRYDEEMAARLFDPVIYATVNIGVQRKFSGGYSLALYENCLRYAKVGSTGWIDLPVLRQLLGATQEYYDDFRRLNNKVVQRAVAEVNKVSDIQIEVEFRRSGRSVAALKFRITQGPQQSLLIPEIVDEFGHIRQTSLFKQLRDHGIGEKLALSFILEDEERARKIVVFTEEKDRRGEIRSSTAGFIRKLMEEKADVGESPYEAKRKAQTMEVSEREKQAQLDEMRQEFIRQQTVSLIRSLTLDERRAHARMFLAGNGAKFAHEFREETAMFSQALSRVAFNAWLNQLLRPSFDETAFARWLSAKMEKREIQRK